MDIITILAAVAITFAFLGCWISKQKRREPFEGLILGLLFGPLGVLIAALMPTGQARASRPSQSKFWNDPDPTWLKEADKRSGGESTSDWLQDLEQASRGKP